jgi:hypothetical protein
MSLPDINHMYVVVYDRNGKVIHRGVVGKFHRTWSHSNYISAEIESIEQAYLSPHWSSLEFPSLRWTADPEFLPPSGRPNNVWMIAPSSSMSQCEHEWKDYKGLDQQYRYCDRCGGKDGDKG